jgi:hypothetical protein
MERNREGRRNRAVLGKSREFPTRGKHNLYGIVLASLDPTEPKKM